MACAMIMRGLERDTGFRMVSEGREGRRPHAIESTFVSWMIQFRGE